MTHPFHGTTILELGDTIAAAGATKTLGDYGAHITKLESPGAGPLRRHGPFPDDHPHLDRGAYHLALDTGKRSIVLDYATPSGLEILIALARTSDLVLFDLPHDTERQIQPLLDALGDDGPTTVSLSVHGADGPFAARQENDLSLFAWSNRMLRHSYEGHEPLRYSPNVATLQWASTATAVTAAAIWGRRHDGVRRRIEVAGVEALAGNVDNWFVPWSFTGDSLPRPAAPSRAIYPPAILHASDGLLGVFAANPPFFGRFCNAIGHPELATDPRFTDPAQKIDHYDEFMAHVDAYLATRTRDQAFRGLQAQGVMAAPILDVSEAIQDEQARARGSYVQIDQPGLGAHTIAGPPFRLADAWIADAAPAFGQHTAEVLTELGYTTDEQLALFRAGVTG